jgi:hypothetical protein
MDKFQQLIASHNCKIVEKTKRSMVVQFMDGWYLTVSSFGSVCFFDCNEDTQKYWIGKLEAITTVQPYKYDSMFKLQL